MLIIVTAVLVIVAALIMVFGPEERQTTNMIIGIILLVLGMGSIGASQFFIKAGTWEVDSRPMKKSGVRRRISPQMSAILNKAIHEERLQKTRLRQTCKELLLGAGRLSKGGYRDANSAPIN